MALPGTNSLEVKLTVDDKLTAALKRVQGELERTKRLGSNWGMMVSRAFTSVLTPVRWLFSHIFSLRNAFLALGAAWATIRIGDYAVKIEMLEESFKNLVKRIGTDAVTALKRMRAATKNTVDDMNLMQTANRAILLGAARSVDDLDALARVSRRLGRAMGMETAKAFDDLALAIGRCQPRILDNIGIIAKLTDAQRKYSEETGKAVHLLTAEERQMAFINHAFDQMGSYLRDLGEDVDYTVDAWGRLKTVVVNLWQDVLRGLLPFIKELSDSMVKWVNENRSAIFNWIGSLLEAADQAVPALIAALKDLFTWLSAVLAPFKEMAKLVAELRAGAARIKFSAEMEGFVRAAGSQLPGGSQAFYRQDRTKWEKFFGVYPKKPREQAAVELESIYTSLPPTEIPPHVQRQYEQYIEARERLIQAERLEAYLKGEPMAKPPEVGPLGELNVSGLGLGAAAQKMYELGRVTREQETPGELKLQKRYAEQVEAAKEPITEFQRMVLGVSDAFNELYRAGTDTFMQIKSLVLEVSDALADNLANGFSQAVIGAKSFQDAMKEMAKAVVEDLIKIIIRLLIVRSLGMLVGLIPGVGSLQGLAGQTPAATDVISGETISDTGFGGLNTPQITASEAYMQPRQHGGIFGVFNKPTLIAERPGLIEAAVPLPDGRHIPVQLMGQGEGAGQVVNNIYINTVDAKSFDKYFRESAGRQQSVIGMIAMRQYQDSRTVRRGMRR